MVKVICRSEVWMTKLATTYSLRWFSGTVPCVPSDNLAICAICGQMFRKELSKAAESLTLCCYLAIIQRKYCIASDPRKRRICQPGPETHGGKAKREFESLMADVRGDP